MVKSSKAPLYIAACAVAAAVVLYAWHHYDRRRELHLNLVTCAPDSFGATLRARWAPRDFWISQVVALEMNLERDWEWKDALAHCRSIPVTSDQKACAAHVSGNRAGMTRCLRHARSMCRLEGAC